MIPLISLAILATGIFLICYAIHSLNKIAQAKGFESDVDEFFHHNPSTWNPLIEFFGGKAQEELSKYDVPVLIMLVSGIVLTVIGGVAIVSYCKETSNKP